MSLKKALAGLRPETVARWRVYDAKNQVLGRLASQLSVVLQGKDKPTYAPNKEEGDVCIVLNARQVALTGRKLADKKYYWHTGYIGGIKERTVKDQMERDCTEVIRKAVLRMLPRNRLTDDRMRKLRIYEGPEHPYGSLPVEDCEPPPPAAAASSLRGSAGPRRSWLVAKGGRAGRTTAERLRSSANPGSSWVFPAGGDASCLRPFLLAAGCALLGRVAGRLGPSGEGKGGCEAQERAS